jgi:hypothetical protein
MDIRTYITLRKQVLSMQISAIRGQIISREQELKRLERLEEGQKNSS